MYKKSSKQWFSIIEILVGMLIFSLWIISVYAVISSSLRINEYNKNYIIAVNLAREQVELLRNNRDYNYDKIQKYDQINPANDTFTNTLTWAYYTVENDFSGFPVNIIKIEDIDFTDESNYEICLNETTHIYSYDCSEWNKRTHFFKYIEIKKISNQELKINSVVKWKIKWEHEFELKTILADWKQL
jgi:Tfp pilus assembly protein PilV